MEIKQVRSAADIQPGNIVIVKDEMGLDVYKALEVKTVEDHTEVILDRRKNIYFSVEKFLEGKSWVKDVGVVTEL